jgi:hypothetical protein
VKPYEWSTEKSKQLKIRYGISFEEILKEIKQGNVLQTISHPNQKRYPSQKIMIIRIVDYIYAVPYKEDEQKRFLKTLYPSRKLTKKFLKERRK